MTILEFAEHIQKLMGSEAKLEFQPLPEDDPKRRRPDIGKAKRVLGWKARVSLDDGLRSTIEWYRAYLGGTP